MIARADPIGRMDTLQRGIRQSERLKMTTSRWIGLQNVEETHRAAPMTFSIPRSDQRASLKVGDLVKLIFSADPPSPTGLTAERMWVEVREVREGAFVGALDNRPSFIANLAPGDLVPFGPEHVAAIYASSSGLRVPYDRFALVSRDVAEEGAFPVEAARAEPDAVEASGWVLVSEHGDRTDLVPMLVRNLVNTFRILDSILDEPTGTRWRWDRDRLEYVNSSGE